jgi:capsular polysaccharide transport system permease protein
MAKVKTTHAEPEVNKTSLNAEAEQEEKAKPAKSPTLRKLEPDGREIAARLKRSGLDPQRMLNFKNVRQRWRYPSNIKYFMILSSFILFVALPSVVISFYMIFVASDQYSSSASFAVRSSSSAAPTDILGVVMQTSADSTTSSSYILNDYLTSQTFFEDISRHFDINRIYSNPQWDWYFRMGPDLPIERKVKYWKSRIETIYDGTSGIFTVDELAFAPEDATALAKYIVKKSEELINNLSEKARRETMVSAQETVAMAEVRLRTVRRKLLDYREKAQEISPEENAKLAYELIGELDKSITAKEATMNTLLGFLDRDSPRITMLRQEIDTLKVQLSDERKRLGSGKPTAAQNIGENNNDNSISHRIRSYSNLALEQEFAEQYYTSALAGLEKARAEAASKSLYLAIFVTPTLSEEAQYPSRYTYSICSFLLLLGIWCVSVLTFYNLSDRN